jgi:hypothetical protein
MHKYRNRIATALLPALLCISGQAFSADNDVLKVTGKFKPGGCGITLTGNGEVNLGDINFAGLHPDGTLLPPQKINMDITCPENMLLRISLKDSMEASKLAYDDVHVGAWKHASAQIPARVFGLGKAGEKNIGAFQMEVGMAKVTGYWGAGDGSAYMVTADSDNQAVWGTNAQWLSATDATIAGHVFVLNRGATPPEAFKTVSAPLTIHPTINRTRELPRESDINLNGRVSFELFVL